MKESATGAPNELSVGAPPVNSPARRRGLQTEAQCPSLRSAQHSCLLELVLRLGSKWLELPRTRCVRASGVSCSSVRTLRRSSRTSARSSLVSPSTRPAPTSGCCTTSAATRSRSQPRQRSRATAGHYDGRARRPNAGTPPEWLLKIRSARHGASSPPSRTIPTQRSEDQQPQRRAG